MEAALLVAIRAVLLCTGLAVDQTHCSSYGGYSERAIIMATSLHTLPSSFCDCSSTFAILYVFWEVCVLYA